jgi:serine/threonine protein kinase
MGEREAITAMLKPGGGLEAFALISRDWSADLVGRVLGSYRVVGLLAEGGMSHVYLGVRDDDQFERNVAIKVAFPAMMTNESRERFYRERDILAGRARFWS